MPGKVVKAPLIRECLASIERRVIDLVRKHDIVVREGVAAYVPASSRERRTLRAMGGGRLAVRAAGAAGIVRIQGDAHSNVGLHLNATAWEGISMDLKRISASNVALLVAALVVLATGVYTDNGGFRLAGILLLVTGILVALGQARDRDGPP